MRIQMGQRKMMPVYLDILVCDRSTLPSALSPVGSRNVSMFFPPLESLALLKTAFNYSSCHTFHIIGKMRGNRMLEGAWIGDKNWENSPICSAEQ